MLMAWAAIGFSAIERYPSILRANASVFSGDGPFLRGLLEQLHEPSRVATLACVLLATLLLTFIFVCRDLQGFTLAICASIVLAPVAWVGYASLLILPLAIVWPRWGPAWLVL